MVVANEVTTGFLGGIDCTWEVVWSKGPLLGSLAQCLYIVNRSCNGNDLMADMN